MAKKKMTASRSAVQDVERLAQRLADEQGVELVEVSLQKESRGKCLLVFIDREGGIGLDDCEKYHRALQPLVEDVDYDIMEVSSAGMDRPIKTRRDFEKNRDALVEVRLFAAQNGSKLYQGLLKDFTDEEVVLQPAEGELLSFPRKAVAIVKPVIDFDEDDLPDDGGEVLDGDFSEISSRTGTGRSWTQSRRCAPKRISSRRFSSARLRRP